MGGCHGSGGTSVTLADGTTRKRRRRGHHSTQRPPSHALGHGLGRQRRPLDRHLGPSRRRAQGSARTVPQAVTLPAGYVARHVQLGYACTVHAAQGQTVDTSHTVLTGAESRQLLYVALTPAGAPTASISTSASVATTTSSTPKRNRPPAAVEM